MSLKKNIGLLFVAQAFTYIVPLVQLPYLARVLSVEHFAIVIFALSIFNLMSMVSDFGLDVSLTKLFVDANFKQEKLNEYFSSSLGIKLFLSLLLPVVSGFIFLYSNLGFEIHYIVIFLISIFIITLNSNWVFQALEKSYLLAIGKVVTTSISLLLIFILVDINEDIIYIPIILIIQSLFQVLFTYIYIFKVCGFRVVSIEPSKILYLFKFSFMFFVSKVSGLFLSSGCIIFLGYYGDPNQVAIYGAAERLYRAGLGVIGPIISALTPYMARTRNYKVFFIALGVVFLISIFGLSIGFVFGEIFIEILFTEALKSAKPILDVFLLSILFSAISMMFGYPALMPIKLEYHANYSVFLSAFILFLLFFALLLIGVGITAIYTVYCLLFCNFLACVYRIFVFIKNKRLVYGN
ncbi:polisoprenol-linked O-antigen transporter [Vibrio campbellii]|uniref:oligosaccharide flippase family protein n=1 Tax=Vibrio campbellii TaxID=680 RepID=UPI0005320B6F|nr:oligosaccharide flippase family protein [Vibrio campbellii]KGR36767.1 polisoprenol-linked O-antigen transporter [Vibrio campbellii]